MLGKLLKYELKATSRTFLPIYIALILVALGNRLFRLGNINLGFGLTTAILVGLFVALGVLTLIVTIQRFNRNLLGDEGYLMFTLPVTAHELIFSKLIATLIWGVISGIIGVITCIILMGDYQSLKEIIQMWPQLWSEFMIEMNAQFKGQIVFMIISVPLIGLFSYIEFILMIYLSLATAQLPIFTKHRGIISFITFFVINSILQLLVAIVGEFIPLSNMPSGITCMSMMIGIGILDVILFIGIHYILSKHLNLE